MSQGWPREGHFRSWTLSLELASRAMASDVTRFTRLAEQVTRATTPDYTRLAEQISSWTNNVAALQHRAMPTPAFNWMCRAAASAILDAAAPDDVRDEPQWRIAANQWLEQNAVALFLWLAAGVITVLFCVATATTPELVNQINTALAMPGVIIGIGLAVWFRPKN